MWGDEGLRGGDDVLRKRDSMLRNGDDVLRNGDNVLRNGDDVPRNRDGVLRGGDDVLGNGDERLRGGDDVLRNGNEALTDGDAIDFGGDRVELGHERWLGKRREVGASGARGAVEERGGDVGVKVGGRSRGRGDRQIWTKRCGDVPACEFARDR